MTTQVMVSLPDEVYQNAEDVAHRTGRAVSEVLTSVFGASLPLDILQYGDDVESLTDDEVMALANSWMNPVQNERLNELLTKNNAGKLDALEQHELSLLMRIYEEGSLRKANALVEAVKRGLRPPLSE